MATSIKAKAVAVTVDGAGNATFTAPDRSVLKPGDRVYNTTGWVAEHYDYPYACNGVCGKIASIIAQTVTLTDVVKSLPSGTYDLHVTHLPRFHQATSGDIAEGSATITNVTVPSAWSPSDRIWGSGLPAGASIVAIDGTTFTISSSATATAQAVRLYDADIYRFSGVPA